LKCPHDRQTGPGRGKAIFEILLASEIGTLADLRPQVAANAMLGLYLSMRTDAGYGLYSYPFVVAMRRHAMAGPLDSAQTVTKLPAQDLDRARRFYRDRLGLEAVEEREGGLRYVCGTTEFHLFHSSGTASGASTQIGFEVGDIDRVVAELRARGVQFEAFDIAGFDVEDDIVTVPNNYPSKGSGERGAFFRDSEGNLLALGQATR
jgi:catechol 2,3-dioxygenase-like lactoylglutathione lyase family enzyme